MNKGHGMGDDNKNRPPRAQKTQETLMLSLGQYVGFFVVHLFFSLLTSFYTLVIDDNQRMQHPTMRNTENGPKRP